MAFLDWSDQLDVGVESMNEQHRGLISLMNQLHELHLAGAERDQLSDLLNQFISRATEHFRAEEVYMAAIGHDDLMPHKRAHVSLLDKLMGHRRAFEQGQGGLAPGFFAFLRLWLSGHIVGTDRSYGPLR